MKITVELVDELFPGAKCYYCGKDIKHPWTMHAHFSGNNVISRTFYHNRCLKKEKEMTKDKMETPTKDQILAAAQKCPEWKDGLKELFPKAFEDDSLDITKECTLQKRKHLCVVHGKDFSSPIVGVITGIDVGNYSGKDEYCVVHSSEGIKFIRKQK